MSSVVNTKSRSGPPVIGGDKTGADIRKISSSGRSVKQDGRAGSLLYLTLTNKKWSIRVPLLHCHIGSRCPCLIGKSRQSDSHCYRLSRRMPSSSKSSQLTVIEEVEHDRFQLDAHQ
ncbi:hypothetical protein V6N13_035008 [Hibiscus sabdariffa]|uniref:Uncharacterized protein n=1 Tax=Hibiscus sabdariffa TaxID=183260 RepID=A0ABR2AFI5_9ROSI